eukprot:Gb_22064 [translate_table: standard]
MGRKPVCSEVGLNRGPWTHQEDLILIKYVEAHGEGSWSTLPHKAGLLRCGRSCRLRWMNYLRPNVKRGNISADEEELIIRLHKLLGNRWSLIAARIPGRTDNEIKNFWNTRLNKKHPKKDQLHQCKSNIQRPWNPVPYKPSFKEILLNGEERKRFCYKENQTVKNIITSKKSELSASNSIRGDQMKQQAHTAYCDSEIEGISALPILPMESHDELINSINHMGNFNRLLDCSPRIDDDHIHNFHGGFHHVDTTLSQFQMQYKHTSYGMDSVCPDSGVQQGIVGVELNGSNYEYNLTSPDYILKLGVLISDFDLATKNMVATGASCDIHAASPSQFDMPCNGNYCGGEQTFIDSAVNHGVVARDVAQNITVNFPPNAPAVNTGHVCSDSLFSYLNSLGSF